MNFEQFDLDARLNSAIESVGYKTPTPIQEQAIPQVLAGRDVLGLAQTGTGKTAAFLLPILQRLTRGPLRQTRALIVAPTRELAEQIHQSAVELGKNTKIRSATVYGGVGKRPQENALRRGTEIIVACPGRLLDLARDGHADFSKLDVLVLDEADHMCDMGFLPDIRRILKLVPEKRQTLFFSATMPSDIRKLADEILNDPVTVQIGAIAPAETVSHALYPVAEKMKTPFTLALLEQRATGRVLIFTRTKWRARKLAQKLDRQGYRVSALQGNMSQNKRQAAINGFRDGRYDILVATDIAARGIDVAKVSHVINYDMPDTVDAYTHRIGRTGRAKRSGEALTLTVHDNESMVRDIERLLGMQIERRALDGFDYGEFDPTYRPRPTKNGSSKNGRSRSNRSSNGGNNRRGSGRRRSNRQRSRSSYGNQPGAQS